MHKNKWEDNIEMDFEEEYECVDGINLAQYKAW
jgi:hypothetical protein